MCGAILFPNTRSTWRNGKDSIRGKKPAYGICSIRVVFTVTRQLQQAFVRNSLFKEHCYHFISFVIELSVRSLLFSFVASFVVLDVLGIL